MQQSIVLNSEKLRSISHASHTAEVTITALAVRERLRLFSDITRTRNTLIRKGEKIVDSDYIAFWKGLQEAGVGVIVFGRKGKPDRFEWHYSMKKVAQAALEGKDIRAERVAGIDAPQKAASKSVPRVRIAKATKKPTQIKVESSRSDKSVYVSLPRGLDVAFSVPSDLSKEEARIIGRALERLSA